MYVWFGVYGLVLYVDCLLTGLWCLFLSSFCLIKKGGRGNPKHRMSPGKACIDELERKDDQSSLVLKEEIVFILYTGSELEILKLKR